MISKSVNVLHKPVSSSSSILGMYLKSYAYSNLLAGFLVSFFFFLFAYTLELRLASLKPLCSRKEYLNTLWFRLTLPETGRHKPLGGQKKPVTLQDLPHPFNKKYLSCVCIIALTSKQDLLSTNYTGSAFKKFLTSFHNIKKSKVKTHSLCCLYDVSLLLLLTWFLSLIH